MTLGQEKEHPKMWTKISLFLAVWSHLVYREKTLHTSAARKGIIVILIIQHLLNFYSVLGTALIAGILKNIQDSFCPKVQLMWKEIYYMIKEHLTQVTMAYTIAESDSKVQRKEELWVVGFVRKGVTSKYNRYSQLFVKPILPYSLAHSLLYNFRCDHVNEFQPMKYQQSRGGALLGPLHKVLLHVSLHTLSLPAATTLEAKC